MGNSNTHRTKKEEKEEITVFVPKPLDFLYKGRLCYKLIDVDIIKTVPILDSMQNSTIMKRRRNLNLKISK